MKLAEHGWQKSALVLLKTVKIKHVPCRLSNNHFDILYTDFVGFRKKFYGIDPIISSTFVGPMEYKDLYPIICFDVSKQSERLSSGVTDITLHCRFKAAPGTTTVAHAVIISDRKLKFKSDGEKLSVLF